MMVLKIASYTLGTIGQSEVCDMCGHIRNKGASIRNDDEGSVEGMPLYMLIMVVVVVAAIGILSGMMGAFSGQNLGEVTTDPDVIEIPGGEGQTSFTVTVKDTDGKPIKGATVIIEGEGVTTAAKTGADGTATFHVNPNLGTKAVGELSIRVTYDGTFGDQTRGTSILLVSV
jgi:hypothetical protein